MNYVLVTTGWVVGVALCVCKLVKDPLCAVDATKSCGRQSAPRATMLAGRWSSCVAAKLPMTLPRGYACCSNSTVCAA